MSDYKTPSYVADAPENVMALTETIAVSFVETVTTTLKESYPGIDDTPREFREMVAAIFHRAEWLALNDQKVMNHER